MGSILVGPLRRTPVPLPRTASSPSPSFRRFWLGAKEGAPGHSLPGVRPAKPPPLNAHTDRTFSVRGEHTVHTPTYPTPCIPTSPPTPTETPPPDRRVRKIDYKRPGGGVRRPRRPPYPSTGSFNPPEGNRNSPVHREEWEQRTNSRTGDVRT